MNTPTVEELRAYVRGVFEAVRGERPGSKQGTQADLYVAHLHLKAAGREDVYHEEYMRHTLIERGWVPDVEAACSTALRRLRVQNDGAATAALQDWRSHWGTVGGPSFGH